MDPTRLLFPALRWSDETGFDHESAGVRTVLERGVGGFILFGGEAGAVAQVVADLQRRAPHPLLFAADLERGCGQQFDGCTPLPPAAAVGALDDLEACWRAGNLTGREARALGLGWVFAPVADLGLEPRNPIVGTRAFDVGAVRVARAVAAWVEGCEAAGALACVKHFPGHGWTKADSHRELPVVDASRAALSQDLIPFAAAVEAGVSSVMTAHVAYPALDPSGVPATRSGPIVTDLLRAQLGFDGLVVTDALIMEGVTSVGPGRAAGASPETGDLPAGRAAEAEDSSGGAASSWLTDAPGEVAAALAALDAGVDALLYPRDPIALADRMTGAVAAGGLDPGRLLRSLDRIAAAAERASGAVGSWGGDEDSRWALEAAGRSLRWIRPPSASFDDDARAGVGTLDIVDDDAGGPYPAPSRAPLVEGLRRHGVGAAGSRTWLAVFCDPRGWKGRAGLSDESRRRVAERAPGADLVLLFGHPRLAADIPGSAPLLCAWGGEALMQEAVVGELMARGGG